MSDELKPEERAAENAWLEFQRTNRRPSWARVISEDSAFTMAKRAAEIALSRAAVKERGEDTKLRKAAQALADQCPREQCYELWETLDSALQQQPGGQPPR